MNAFIKKVTKTDQKLALSSVTSLLKSDEKTWNRKKVISIKVQGLEEEIVIPTQAFMMLKSILNNMAKGKGIALLLSDSELTTQQAADILNVSRPHLVKLLNEGKIPYRKVGTHRRVLLKAVLDYESNLKKERRKKLDLLAKEAQELNLGYD